jgi:hypothetical protein
VILSPKASKAAIVSFRVPFVGLSANVYMFSFLTMDRHTLLSGKI